MKKSMKAIISLILAIIMATMMCVSVYAIDLQIRPTFPVNSTSVDLFFSEYTDFSLITAHPLYNTEGVIIAYYCALAPTGYLVVSVQGKIIEYSLSKARTFALGSRVYYGGPMSYFVKIGDEYADIYSGIMYAEDTLSAMYSRYEAIAASYQNSASVAPAAIVIPPSDETHTTLYTPNTSNHYLCTIPHGDICTSVAVAILLQYYNDYIDGDIVPANLDDNQIALVHELLSYIAAGSTMVELVEGFGDYLVDIDMYFDYAPRMSVYQFSQYFGHISDNTPVIVGIYDHPDYENHAAVAYGYRQVVASNGQVLEEYCIVSDGWFDNDVYIDSSYVGGFLYLEEW